MAGERLPAKFSLCSQVQSRLTETRSETATSHMRTVTPHIKMNQRQILDTALKILSLYFLIKGVSTLRDIVLYLGMGEAQNAEDGFVIWLMFGGMFINLITNVLFFWIFAFKSDSVLTFLRIEDASITEKKQLLGLEKMDWIEIGIIIVGIIAITFSLPEILYLVADRIYFQEKPTEFILDRDSRPEILYSIFKFGIGLIVIIYSRQLSKAIVKRSNKDDILDLKNEYEG